MSSKRTITFLSELLLLALIGQLFWPIMGLTNTAVFTWVIGCVIWLLLGRWWSYVFFGEYEMGFWERMLTSGLLGGTLLLLSYAYLSHTDITLHTPLGLIVTSFWILIAMIRVHSKRRSSH